MRIIDGIRATGRQVLTIQGFNDEQIKITFIYDAAAQRWRVNLDDGNFVLNGLKLVNHPNLLVQYSNIVKYGLACITTTDKGDPFLINDFSAGRCQAALLTEEEVSQVEEVLFEG